MVIVLPLEIIDRLIAVAQLHQLRVPIPLSSPYNGYLASEELTQIQAVLSPLAVTCQQVASLLEDLHRCVQNPMPVAPAR
ncbi:MAG: hypothetical protein HC886_04760 [Leptolyngbyaceae cyanobacterium SM1_1_3]|nr:hypothetical protein [Leptolyngbyaceae cyanobacterium SM1_1_3]NJN04353.1 hypothetical protein [Leptolyngbyaceae cyanobacterium RM1_1_2]NJO09661.1 hypothetical protein [Leptolyngbyaceae cyanobacterium SL_1_1]